MYECTAEIEVDGGIKLSKHVSKRTGMTVCIAQADGPIVGTYICIATEAHDDDGLPHTLEHLVFMGSKQYPYKGILDMLASRCLSQGTNAWTDTDHTCYTLTTAGSEGTLALLPIYLDHLLYPTLTDLAYVTEVHHITGEGEDAGIVYAEMQARENTGESLCYLAMLREMYPGDCGYKSETGGLTKNIRDSTSNEKVKNYHKQFYRPENMSVIIVGQVTASEVFKAIDEFENRVVEESAKDPDREAFERPWQQPVPPLPGCIVREVEYPCDEDDYGLVITAWRGPDANDHYQALAIQALMDYLTDTSMSPLNRELVEIDDPYCNQVPTEDDDDDDDDKPVSYSIIENSVSCVYLHFSNVSTEKLTELKEKLFAVLNGIANGTEELDMTRMKTIIRKKKLHILTSMESSPHDQIAGCMIADFLYGKTLEDLENRTREIPIIDKLYDEPSEYWINLLKRFITEADYVTIIGKPSPELSKLMADAEKERIKKQKEVLGSDGLKEKADIVESAIEASSIKAPKEMMNSIDVPSTESIKFHPIKRVCNVAKQENDVGYNIESMPCRFQLDVINTNFVRSSILMDTCGLSHELRMYLPLFVELLGECAIQRNNELIPYQDVVREIEEDTIAMSASVGFNYRRFFCGEFAQIISLEFMVEEDRYEKSVQWARDILYHTVFEPSRIKVAIKKMITSLGTLKRKERAIMRALIRSAVYQKESNHWTANMFRQSKFLTSLLGKLEKDGEAVVKDLVSVRDFLTQPDRLIVHTAINLDNLKQKVEPEKPWIESFLPKNLEPCIKKTPIKHCSELLRGFSEGSNEGEFISIGSAESSHLIQCTTCLNSYTNPDYPALLVLLQYLVQQEGPMWREIRGKGLAYSYDVFLSVETGLIYLTITDSNNLPRCYEEALRIVESHLDNPSVWENELLESSRSSVVFDVIERIKTVSDVTEESLRAYLIDLDLDFLHQLLTKVTAVTIDDLKRVGSQYMRPLFDSYSSKCAVGCNPIKTDEIVEGFKKFSRTLRQIPSLDDSSLSDY